MAVTDREYLINLMQDLRQRTGPISVAGMRNIADGIEQRLRPGMPRVAGCDPTQADHSYNAILQKCVHGVIQNGLMTCLPCADPAFHAASRNNPTPYQTFTLTGMPQAGIKEVRDKYQVNGYPYDEQPFQNFWRCEHHPSALDNYFARRECTMGCNMNELRWFDNGTCKPQTS
jgi:hypothetical protein